jgi:4-hydroxybenzoate polyprenyltransferase
MAAGFMQNHVRDPELIARAEAAAGEPPICSDLDGTVVKSNMLMETLVALLRQKPFTAFLVPFWLLRGRAALKRELAAHATVDVSLLPYDENLMTLLRGEQAAGRRIVLATAADRLIAEPIGRHLGFDEVLASDGRDNLKGEAKAAELVRRYGELGYEFVGEDRFDLPCWKHARAAVIVGGNDKVRRKVEALGLPRREIPRESHRIAGLARALRLHQWAKNLLLLVPLLTAHKVLDAAALSASLLAFLSFSLVASAVYVANDLADIEDDRRHPTKRMRPFASGALPLAVGLALVPALLAAGALLALRLPMEFGALLLAYVVANLAYSLGVKRVAMLDVFLLAGLYTLRILAGAAAIDVPVSHWLLAFSMFAFLSLALVKRFVEVTSVAARAETRVGGRGYLAGDGQVLAWLGTASGYLAVLVFALYITSREVVALYRHPAWLWFACPLLLFWISRVWLLAHRGALHEDPVVFALRDISSYGVGLAILLVMAAAT